MTTVKITLTKEDADYIRKALETRNMPSNIVSLSDRRKQKQEEKVESCALSDQAVENYFEEVVERNKQIQQRRREERKVHNQALRRETRKK